MDVLVANEQELIIEWDPRCKFTEQDGYDYEMWCYTGTNNKSYKKQFNEMFIQNTNIIPLPKTILVLIEFARKNRRDTILYKQIVEDLTELMNSGDKIKIMTTEPVSFKRITGLNPEYANEIAYIDNEYKKRDDEVTELLDKLTELGCNVDKVDRPNLEYPEEYYNYDEFYELPHITVYCNENTQFYKFLKNHNWIEKYCPDWYRQGYKERYGIKSITFA